MPYIPCDRSDLPADAKPVPGYRLLFATPEGVIWSCRRRKAIALTPNIRQGRPRIKAGFNSDRPDYVHTLVAATFIGPLPAGQEVRHLDGNPMNNRVSNLAYGTHAENGADSRRLGECRYGEANHKARTTAINVQWMRAFRRMGFKVRAIAEAFGVSVAGAEGAISRRTWKRVL